ncbi:unnamed protein product [marine sediment metagenome]|uniref:Arsenosugar biosynthesis radical SAM protein ArsS-like C-terminal domain-containing protein n=1 Tax=marine sediment metagenome TaxID=412755 RepID=X1BWZ0_9ZZZZ
MSRDIMQQVISLAECSDFKLVDITGGAPELNEDFRWFIESLRALGKDVQVRTNLAWIDEQEDENIPNFLADNKVSLVGSLPCYMEENVDTQRGYGTYSKSIDALKSLNALGYGGENGLQLHLVYNPSGAFLAGSQEELEKAYKKELLERFNIVFTSLIVITNMPIGRFRSKLQDENQDQHYMKLLTGSFNPETITHLMCRHQLCVDWDGSLYDCDFNIALGMPLNHSSRLTLSSATEELTAKRAVVTGNHCFGCTAGSGSSCAGSLTS